MQRAYAAELHFLETEFKLKYLEEMALVAEAVYNAFRPQKLNYELLGNGETHLHWHIFPRNEGDMPEKGPVWWLPKEEMWNDSKRPAESELEEMKITLKTEIEKLILR